MPLLFPEAVNLRDGAVQRMLPASSMRRIILLALALTALLLGFYLPEKFRSWRRTVLPSTMMVGRPGRRAL